MSEPTNNQPRNNYPLSKEEYDKLMDRIKEIYPKEIDLAQFAQQREYGYEVNVPKSTKQAVVLCQKDRSGNTIDTIIVRKNANTKNFYYTNPNNSQDKGQIQHFVMNRKGTTSYIAVDKVLSSYLSLDNLKEKEPQIKKVNIASSNPESRAVSMVRHYNLVPLEDTRYLKSRGFSENTLNSYEFHGRVLNENYNGFKNTAFPMYNREGEIVGIERKNFAFNSDKEFGGAAEGSNKQQSLWYSKVWPDAKIDKFVIGETAIDLMSHHQLNRVSDVEKNVYIASNGHWTKEQIEIVQELVHKNKPQAIVLANDNDLAGKRFNISLIGQLNKPLSNDDMALNPLGSLDPQPLLTKDNKLTVECNLPQKFVVELKFNAVFDNQAEGLKLFKNIEDKIEAIRNVSSQKVESRIVEMSDKKGVYGVTFVNSSLELSKAQEIVMELRDMSKYMSVDKAKGKDFNEDLKVQQGLMKDEKATNLGKEAKIEPLELARKESFDLSKELPNSKEFEERKSGFGR